MDILERINTHEDLLNLDDGQRSQLCDEIRQFLIDSVSKTGGHLAGNLGVVELSVAIETVFDTNKDRLVFDVGHQSYVHKLLTGRRADFARLRQYGGISGFPKPSESDTDAFVAGHASSSVSIALGMARARTLLHENYDVVTVIGDGALTGGLAYEALNNAGGSKADLLIILNDNNQSIDHAIGGLHQHLLRITTSRRYNRFKNAVWNRLGDKKSRQHMQMMIRNLKSRLVMDHGGDVFESLGIRYFGPVDGNDVCELVEALRRLKDIKGPRVLHCLTQKGCGYAPALEDPVVWHAPGRFNPETGERIVAPHRDRYQDVFGEVLCRLAREDKRVVGITPAMASGCGMVPFSREFPERFYDVGIEEEHAVTFSAGLAAAGLKPFCNIYSSFSQRAYDQIIHDVALQKLPVVLCFDRSGVVGEDGATHHGAFDLAAYRVIPDCIVSAPADEAELRDLMYTALRHDTGPFIIRYPRGEGEGVQWRDSQPKVLPVGKASELLQGSSIAVVAIGPSVARALEAAAEFPGQVGVYNFRFLKPLDTEMLDRICASYRTIITVEDGSLAGGLYGAVCEYVQKLGSKVRVSGLGLPDAFIQHDRQSAQRAAAGIDKAGICAKIKEFL